MAARPTAVPLTFLASAIATCGCEPERLSNEDTEVRTIENGPQSPAQSTSGFSAMDGNADGQITANEHASAAARMFDMMDATKDGAVTSDEMDAMSSAVGASEHLSAADKIKVIDTNGDGRLSRQEHVDGSKAMFAKMDRDVSGSLSQAEFDAGHEAMLGS